MFLKITIEMKYFLKILIVFLGFELITAQIAPIVETHLGKIRGSIMKTEKGSEFMGFRGIRYAEAPVGEKRFQAPVAVKKWSGEFDATKDGFMCPQIGKPMHMLSEDCLILNVYTKNLTEKRPVIVFIHGGANINGASHSVQGAGPDYLMESDIVFVAMNFRLGPLGHLTTRTKNAPGNYAYLDQVMALEWVHDHISKFGGNPRSVTLLGMSSGSIDVTLHLASPRSVGLFHKAVAMSGSASADYAFDNLYWTRKLALDCSCPMFNPVNLLDCLRKLPWTTIVNVSTSWNFYNMIDMRWGYEIDGYFMTMTPTESFAEGNFSKVPIMTGITKDEFTFIFNIHGNNAGLLNDINLNFEKYAQELFTHNFEDAKINKAHKVKKFYLGSQAISKKTLTTFGDIFSDALVNLSIHRMVELVRKYVDVYYYRFDYVGRYGVFENSEGQSLGANHADDLQYIIKRIYLRERINYNDPEWFMVERMVRVVSTFAENGSPPSINGVNWLPTNKTQVNTLYIDRHVKLGIEPFKERLQLWDTLFPVEKKHKRKSK